MSLNLIILAVILIAIAVFGLSMGIIFRGRMMETEVGENRNMQKLGIKCAKRVILEEDMILRGEDISSLAISNCGDCHTFDKESKNCLENLERQVREGVVGSKEEKSEDVGCLGESEDEICHIKLK